jgi:hypothetical protein
MGPGVFGAFAAMANELTVTRQSRSVLAETAVAQREFPG